MSGASWWVQSFPANMAGGAAQGAQGGYMNTTDALSARNPLDAARQNANQHAPGASYPDGYLGTIEGDRRDGRNALLQQRLTPGSYNRGVHKGSKIDQSDYFWTKYMNPDQGLIRQMKAEPVDVEGAIVFMSDRAAPTGNEQQKLVNDGKNADMLRPGNRNVSLTESDPATATHLRQFLPPWR